MMKVDLAARELVIRANDGSEQTYSVDEHCPLLLDGKSAALDELQRFDSLDITYEHREKLAPKALTIDARRPIKQ
jgi:hypothetical protein